MLGHDAAMSPDAKPKQKDAAGVAPKVRSTLPTAIAMFARSTASSQDICFLSSLPLPPPDLAATAPPASPAPP